MSPVLTRRHTLAGLAGLPVLAARTAAARPLDTVTGEGTLRVALYAENAPFSEMRDGRPVGIDVDVAEALATILKVRLDLRLVDAGENVDGDFRLNLWRGDLAGSPLADLMLHVPHDRLLGMRNEQVFLVRPYFEQRLAFAWARDRMEAFESFPDIGDHAVAVEGASASDLQILMAESGRYRNNLTHFRTFDEAAQAFLRGEAAILAGTRPSIEAALHAAGAGSERCPIVEIAFGGLVKTSWELGGAVRSDSRDLGYAVGEGLAALIADGRLAAICARHGVGFRPPNGF
ncbi:substrate-binding periplasmic protein [Methylobacterium sp. Leaf118]|uniref:substrate-binding periplasmic protein n=1 Tax=Methylobacterium sp. Leaf118 TaxID=2876562 RepID=UPI001E477F35|nr:transporter substrate-binding domain-containing protein [Methylobacterium sp. Leaf118]